MDELARRREINDVMRHDMRTRVGIGKGYVAMLRAHLERMTPEQRETALQGLAEAFDRLDEFVRRVLMDEKIETHDLTPQRGDTPVSVLADAARAAHPGAVVEVDPSAPETAYVDPVMAREVVDNLVANARAAAPAGTDVVVRFSGGAGRLRIGVRDAGGGITDEDREVLFTRYGRTARAREAGAPGLGLGLSIVRRLVEAHGGTYGVELGDGTEFWVDLPVSRDGVPSP